MVTSWRRMTSRFRHGLGTAGPPRPLQADTPVTWVTKVINAVGYRTSNGRFPKRENRMTSRFRHGLGTAGPPRPLQADTPVTWVTKVTNAVGYRTSNGRFPKRENRKSAFHNLPRATHLSLPGALFLAPLCARRKRAVRA